MTETSASGAAVCGWSLRGGLSRGVRAVATALLLPVVGCNGFFQCENKPACPASTGTGTGTGTGTSTVDYAYVAYTTTAGSSVIAGFNLAGGVLTAIAPVTLPFVPIAMAVNPANSLLYVASVPGYSNFGVYAYSIGTGGVLTAANGGAALATDSVGAMAISPDGNYLYTVQSVTETMTEYAISATGGLTSKGLLTVLAPSCTLSISAPVVPTCGVAVAPTKDYLAASLDAGGVAFFTYTSASGVPSQSLATVAAATASDDFSVAFDGGDNAYVVQTGTMTRFALASTGVTNEGYFTYPAGSIPRGVVVDPGSKFVYTADVGTDQITGIEAGTVNQLTGSPFAAPPSVAALGIDSTDTYLVAAGYSATAGVQLYSIATSGVLSALAQTAGTTTATQYPVLVAMTH